jgi:hypothetical protein
MSKKQKLKISATLLSGILLGILFIVACNAASSGGETRAVSSLSVYDADGDSMGTFISADYYKVLVQLGDGKLFKILTEPFATEQVYYAALGCAGTPHVSTQIANQIVPMNSGNYFVAIDAVEVTSFVYQSVESNNPITGVHSCGATSGTLDSAYPTTTYLGTVPTVNYPIEIR